METKSPKLSIHAVTKEKEIGEFIEKTDILFTSRISDGLIKEASKLKWIQAKTAGVDYLVNLPPLKKKVMITFARGIHGPQMSEMAILLMLALNRKFIRIHLNLLF